jgi:hypothetical protein
MNAPVDHQIKGDSIVEKKLIPYTITKACLINGERKEIGTVVQMEAGEGNYLVASNKAVKGEQKLEAPKAAKKEEKK